MFNTRTWNILLRTAHIAAMGVLLGGYAFNVQPPSRLLVSLWLTVGTGLGLGLLEAGPRLLWFHQGRGLMTIAKLSLLCAVPLLENYCCLRLTVLLAVVVIASVGSHMPARYRYYSIVYRDVITCQGGPGAAQLAAESVQQETGQTEQERTPSSE